MAARSGAAASGLTLVRTEPRTDDPAPSDRRVHPRLTLSDLDWLNTIRLKYGPVVSLIDLSSGGAQIETTSRLNPGAPVVVQISGSGGEIAVPSTVVRSQVSRVAPYMMYRSALSFRRAIETAQPAVDKTSDAFTSLLSEHARMTGAIRRLSHACTGGDPAAIVGDDILTSTLGLIQSPAGRRAGDSFRRHLTVLFRDLTRGIEAAAPADTLLSALADRLRRSVPTRVIHIADGGTGIGPHREDTVYFDAAREGSVVARLVVEFPRDCQLEAWHLHFLRVAAQLVALVNDVSALRERAGHDPAVSPKSPPRASEPAPLPFAALPPAPVPAGVVEAAVPATMVWVPVVARYADGRVLKGYCRGFVPARGYVSVAPAPDAPQSAVSTLLLRHLKAVFFVHDLAGAPPDVEPTPAARGRDIIVTFMDGEVLSGTTLNYAVDGAGFYLSPHDQRGNNLRIFVINEAVRHVQFP
ncbi:MAG TPA: PilZ domain-containing protein [Vicinamibacterales bacterium]|nr:PilZ domain-containing protein [Vicinamibacterales bacterium]